MRERESVNILHGYLTQAGGAWPDAVAIEDGEKTITFQDLHKNAQALGRAMQSLGLEKGDRVALILPKSIEGITAAFAVLFAGGIFVPVDMVLPLERIQKILAACGPKLIIASSIRHLASLVKSEIAGLESPSPSIVNPSTENMLSWAKALDSTRFDAPYEDICPGDPAYILFTSGSTGCPKGVTISHRAACAFVEWSAKQFKIDRFDRLACPSPLSFDLSTFDMFNMVYRGATDVLIPREIGWKPKALSAFIAERKITAWYSVPSTLTLLLSEGGFAERDYPDLRLVLFAGEVFPVKYLKRLRDALPAAELYNLYGPTETNVITYYQVPRKISCTSDIPIGIPCPYANVKFATAEEAAAWGVDEKELLAEGQSLMNGYWGMAEETKNAFVKISVGNGGKDQLFYRTGDRTDFDESGYHYIFLGRVDRQIKRRGYRIELGEIETVLNRHVDIRESAVTSCVDSEGQVIIGAFITPAERDNLSEVAMKTFCAQSLPSYMVPDRFIIIDSIPKNSRGKFDYHLLRQIMQKGRPYGC